MKRMDPVWKSSQKEPKQWEISHSNVFGKSLFGSFLFKIAWDGLKGGVITRKDVNKGVGIMI